MQSVSGGNYITVVTVWFIGELMSTRMRTHVALAQAPSARTAIRAPAPCSVVVSASNKVAPSTEIF